MKARLWLAMCVLILAVALLAGPALAAGGYQLTAWVAAGGGGGGQNGGYSLTGTLGLAEAAPVLSNGPYSLRGGFWQAAFPDWRTFVPVAKK